MNYPILQDSFFEYVFIGVLYLVAIPVLAILAAASRNVQRGLFAGMVLLVAVFPTYYTTSLFVWHGYRGLPRGFEFSVMEALAVALIIGCLIRNPRQIRLAPAGLLFYGIYCGLSFLSIVNADQDVLVWMCLWKFLKGGAVLAAAYYFFQEEEDINLLCNVFVVALVLNFIACLKQRYLGGMYRVTGGFEHSNPLAMWSYFVSLPLLAAALSKKASWKRSMLYLFAYGLGGMIVVLTVTRTSLAIFGIGSLAILIVSVFTGLSFKRLLVFGLMVVGTVAVLGKSADTIHARITESKDYDKVHDLRYVLNEMSQAMFEDHPVIGVGWNNSAIVNSRPNGKYSPILERWASIGSHSYANPEHYTANPQTESLYWLLASENGIAGLASWLLFCAITYLWCLENAITYRHSWIGFMFLAIAIVLTFAYSHSIIERILTQPKNLALWLILLGMVAKFRYLKKPRYDTLFVVISGVLSTLQGSGRRSWTWSGDESSPAVNRTTN